MDKHPSIDELFAKARQQAPVASLDETREAFLKNVGVPVAKSKVFTSKKWIMFYSVITITAISAVVFFQQNTHKQEKRKHLTRLSNQLLRIILLMSYLQEDHLPIRSKLQKLPIPLLPFKKTCWKK